MTYAKPRIPQNPYVAPTPLGATYEVNFEKKKKLILYICSMEFDMLNKNILFLSGALLNQMVKTQHLGGSGMRVSTKYMDTTYFQHLKCLFFYEAFVLL